MRLGFRAWRWVAFVLALAAGLGVAASLEAQTGTGAATTTTNPPAAGTSAAGAPATGQKLVTAVPTQIFRAWALDCLVPTTGANAGKRVCFIHHESKAATDPKLVAARAVIRHAGPDRKLMLIVQVPPNTVQASGLTAAIDAGTPVPIAISGCLPQFCYGATELTEALAAAAKAGHQMTLVFTAKDAGAQNVAVPLLGVTAALAALEQTGS